MRGHIADSGAIVNIVSHDEHVPEIERYNCTIKDRVRSQYTVLSFDYIPPVLVVELVYIQCFGSTFLSSRVASLPPKAHQKLSLTGRLTSMLIARWSLVSMSKLMKSMTTV